MKTLISTQMPQQFDRLQALLRNKVRLINIPMIKIERAELTDDLQYAVNNADTYNWIIFTSMRAVEHFFEIYSKNINTLASVKFACIGKSTQQELSKYEISTDYLNPGKTSIDFANHLISNNIIKHGDKVLHPTGNRAGKMLKTELLKICNFNTVVIYNTLAIENINKDDLNIIKNQKYELILFTSPSAFINFVEITKHDNRDYKLKIASIGSITNKTINNLGYEVLLTADKPDLQVLADNILKYSGIS